MTKTKRRCVPRYCYKDPELGTYVVTYSDRHIDETPATSLRQMRELGNFYDMRLVEGAYTWNFVPRPRPPTERK